MSDSLEDGVYRNADCRFSIRFPPGWEVRAGDGKTVVQQAFGPNKTGINVVVNPANQMIPEADFDAFFRVMETAVVRQVGGKLQQKGVGEINGERVGYLKVEAVLTTPEGPVNMIVQTCLARKNGLEYMISAMIPTDRFDEMNPAITDAFASFAIEG